MSNTEIMPVGYALRGGHGERGDVRPAPSLHAAKIRARKQLKDSPGYWRGAVVGHMMAGGALVPLFGLERGYEYIGWMPS